MSSWRTNLVTARVLVSFMFIFLVVFSPVHASGPGNVQITQDNNSSCNGTQQICEDGAGLPGGPSAASAFASDSKGNLIVAFSCSQFENCNGGNNHHGFLAWSNDKGATWTNCVASGDCVGGTPFTTNLMTTALYTTCFYSGAIYVSGSTVDFAYAHNTANGVANYYVDRFQITYSGNAITSIFNGGPETAIVNNGISDSSAGFSCIQQVIPSPNANEIIAVAFEPNSGPAYIFRTGVTTSAYKDLSGTASSITGSSPGRYDSVNGCIGIQPATNDLWLFQVDQAGPDAFHTSQFAYSAGNWGTATTNNPISSNDGSPNITYGASCASDTTDNILYFTWFKCNLSGGGNCAAGAPASGTTCNFQLWEATSSSSSAVPTQLASLTDTGACHATQNANGPANFVGGGGSSLTFVNGQLWLTGVDDNLFAPGCSTPVIGGNAACCPSEASGTTTASCQQLFLAKYTISGNSWGAITQYAGNPFGVLGEAAFLSLSTGNYYLVYSSCATVSGTNVSNGGYLGTADTNDGGCQVGNTGSLWSDPVFGAAPPVLPPVPPQCSGTTGGCAQSIAQQSVFAVIVILMLGAVSLYMIRGTLDPVYYQKAMMYIVVTAVVILIIAAASIG